MLENTEGVVKKDNPKKLATQETQDTGQINDREYRRGNEKGQSRKKLAIQVTQDTGQINVRECRRGNEKMTIQKNWQRRIQKTQDKYILENTEGVMQKDNPYKLAIYDTKDTGQINVREYQSGNTKGQSR